MQRPISFSWIQRNLVLTILAIAYLAMSALIVEQNRVIDSQRVLIRQLFNDSQALSAIKIQQLREFQEELKK